MKQTFRSRIREWRYWHITRKTQNFVPWLARKLPRKLKYYVVIHGMVSVEPNVEPTSVTGMQMLKLWNPDEIVRSKPLHDLLGEPKRAENNQDLKVCPECTAGKHNNCDGFGDIDDDDNLLRCGCWQRYHLLEIEGSDVENPHKKV